MRYALDKCIIKKRRLPWPFMKFENNILTEVNTEFENLTGYMKSDIIGKSTEEIDDILKITSQIHLRSIEEKFTGYIFTKSYEPRKVIINCSKQNEYVVFTIKEKENSRIEDSLPFINPFSHDDLVSIALYDYKAGILLKFNDKYLGHFGKDGEKVGDYVGRKVYDEFWELVSNENNEITSIQKINKPIHLREVQYNLSNNIVYYDISFIPISNKKEVIYIVHRTIDVTERVLERKHIEQQKKELEIILESMSEELIIFNKEGQYTRLNKAARESAIFDYVNAKDVRGFSKQAEVYEMDGTKISFENLPLNEVLRNKTVSKRIIRRNIKNNKIAYCDVSGNPIYDSEGNFLVGILVLRNIDARIKEEESLYIKTQYESLYKIVENLNLGYTAVSYPKYKIKYLNKNSFDLVNDINGNISMSSAIGEDMFNMFKYKEEEIKDLKFNLDDTIKCNKGTYSLIRKLNILGQDKYRKVIYQPIYNLHKMVDQIAIISFDITEEIKSKIDLEQALKLQDEIYANISHELKTPLNVIFSANQIQEFFLKDSPLEPIRDKLISYNNSVKQNCLRLIKLINNIVDMSKVQTGHLQVELVNKNIVEIVENITLSVSEYTKSAGLRIIFDTDSEEKIIACDPNIIERILLNLISNAIKFTNANGEILVSVLDKNDMVEINVKDSGIGIEKKNLVNIFKRFYQVDKSLSRNSEGSGIGLSLVKSFVDLHGGNISVKSEVGKGSEFKIKLPAITVDNPKEKGNNKTSNSKIEMLSIEFSDIYNI